MRKLLLYPAIFCSMIIVKTATAQKVSMDEIKQQCNGLPTEKRVRLSVSSFTNATPTAEGKFGDELAQMLTTALQEVNCFNVLLSLKDIDNATDELKFNQKENGNTAQDASIQAGKMKGAQVIVMGKVTDYFPGTSNNGSLGAGKAKIGFTIQLVNPQTREIIAAKAINVQGKTVIGIGGTSNKSLADACEKGIYQAVEFIAANKDNMALPAVTDGGTASASKTATGTKTASSKPVTEITITNADYSKLKAMVDVLATKGKVLDKTVSNGTASIKFEHDAAMDVADFIDSKLGSKYSIKDVTDGKITIEAK